MRKIEEAIKEVKEEVYLKYQKASGLKVGDKVRVLRKAEDFENGWTNAWVEEEMDRTVGQTDIIESIQDYGGINLESNGLGYPFFVLKKVPIPIAELLEGELKEKFRGADIKIDGGGDVSISQDTFYTVDRAELLKLEKKYRALLWCDARNEKVHYVFHSLHAPRGSK